MPEAMDTAGLINTFLHIRGCGEKRERALWQRGVTTWHRALSPRADLKGCRAAVLRRAAQVSVEALAEGDAAFFSQRLPPGVRLRLLGEFARQTAYVDIETDPYRITLIGVFFQDRYHAFVASENLEDLYGVLREVKVLVTYNGSRFDLPFLKRAFFNGVSAWCRPAPSDLFVPPRGVHLPGMGHIDLMPVLHRVGIRGGLKAAEERLGIVRPEHVRGLSGYDAVRLWHQYRSGNPAALELLIEYNRQDVVNLKRIVDMLQSCRPGALQLRALRRSSPQHSEAARRERRES